MTFKEALQAEIDLQGLSVAQLAKDSGLSKGAIYNILNGTTEDERIRPATRKAIADACDREIRADGDGVRFVERGAAPSAAPTTAPTESVVMSWQRNRPFRHDRHAAAAFDWLHQMEESGKLDGMGVVDRVYQNRPDFLALTLHNRGTDTIASASLSLRVEYANETLSHAFDLAFPCSLAPGDALEATVFACVGAPFELACVQASVTDDDEAVHSPALPEPFSFGGGPVD